MRGVGTEDDVRLPIPHASVDQPEGAGSLGLGQSHSQEPAEELAFLSDTSTWLLERPYPQTKHHKQTTLRDPPCSSQVTFLSLLMATGKLTVPSYSGFDIF